MNENYEGFDCEMDDMFSNSPNINKLWNGKLGGNPRPSDSQNKTSNLPQTQTRGISKLSDSGCFKSTPPGETPDIRDN